jgi:hypothetical protein
MIPSSTVTNHGRDWSFYERDEWIGREWGRHEQHPERAGGIGCFADEISVFRFGPESESSRKPGRNLGKAHGVHDPGGEPMSIKMSNDKNIPTDTDAYYETVASQEEIYLEETEEEVREILISENRSTAQDNDSRLAESLDQQRNHAAEELITGDSDDPPLSEEAIGELLNRDLAGSKLNKANC